MTGFGTRGEVVRCAGAGGMLRRVISHGNKRSGMYKANCLREKSTPCKAIMSQIYDQSVIIEVHRQKSWQRNQGKRKSPGYDQESKES